MLCGYLLQDATYIECGSYEHLETAKEIAHKYYNETIKSGIKAEDFLYEKGVVGFFSRNAGHRFISEEKGNILLLTKEQLDFIINNLDNANNDEQKNAIKEILDFHDGYASGYILN